MQNIYDNPAELEKIVKAQYGIPDFVMMENAAHAIADLIIQLSASINKEKQSVIILCGKGNNGGDGLALARILQDKFLITIVCPDTPTEREALTQYQICKKLGLKILTEVPSDDADFVVDCLFGIGFYGQLAVRDESLLAKLGAKKDAIKIACDIPSALFFRADYTVTMGEQKFALYSDRAKAKCGQIILADLGIAKSKFEDPNISEPEDSDSFSLLPLPAAYLIEPTDMKLPLRTERDSHKGSYGHTVVFTGSKAGAGVMAGTAALSFGSGLATLLKTENSNLEQFKISPQLMVTDKIPEKASCLILGPGIASDEGEIPVSSITMLMDWFEKTENPACVLDADIFSFIELKSLLEELNKKDGARIILTPHLKEYEKLVDKVPNLGSLKNITVVRKSANTLISAENNLYICADGSQSLAKGGSGDILAGMIGALLSQNYSAKDAAITAVEAHALAGRENGEEDFSLTPEKLLSYLKK